MLKTVHKSKLNVLELFVAFLSILAITSVIFLLFKSFNPLFVLLFAAFISIILFFVLKLEIELKDTRFDYVILIIVLFSLVIRLGPWMYYEGGQDQGLYVAMSKQFEIYGGIKYGDNIDGAITEELKQKYIAEKGWYSLGYLKDKQGSIHTNFYPAHPALMSISGYLFGQENRVATLTIFSVLSIIFAYLLTTHISGNKYAGYLAAILISINPLHLYFSKFPVTEIMTLFLNLSTLYFILKAKTSSNYLYLLLSLLTFNALLYTRLTWVVALPFFLLLVIAQLTYAKDMKEYKAWGIWALLILISMLISTYFYYLNIPFLYKSFYSDIFKYIPANIYYPFLISSPIWIYLITTKLNRYLRILFEFIYKYRNWIIGFVMIFLLYISIKNFYIMVFTDKYIGNRYDYFWGMARGGWVVLKDMAISSLIIYLTPFGILALFLSISKNNSVYKSMLWIFFLIYTLFHFYIVKYTPYHFYFARYQLSEIVPIALIFISIYLVDLYTQSKVKSLLLLIPIVIYSAIYIPFITLQGHIGTTPSMFERLEEVVDKENDVVLYYNPLDWADNFIFSPLKYYFNFRAVSIQELAVVDEYSNGLVGDRDLYILSTEKIDNDRYELVDTLKFEKGFLTNAIEDKPPLTNVINDWKIPYCDMYIPEKFCSGAIPIKYHRASLDIYLYNYK